MRHHNANKKFGRERNARRALMRSLVRSLIIHGKITTTEAKAKALRPFVEGLVTKARRGTPQARRLVTSTLMNEKSTTRRLFTDIAPKYEKRQGGYTRIVKLPRRKSDGSPMALIEFV
ncbi:50S ribosomal protein L17 [Candidatus Parcubacteria bacterium]|nr:50S ribosomal protein L17 [Candidatus Parcubacteria bacterium]